MGGVTADEWNDKRDSAENHRKVYNERQGAPASRFDGAAGYLRTDHFHQRANCHDERIEV